jgi:hypothetical protein
MKENILPILFLSLPAICGGVIALLNSAKVNDASEKLEALTRRRQGVVSVKRGFFSKWIIHPPLRVMVKLCDWTDSLAHRGLKNGIRVAAALYVLGFWLLLVAYAFMFVLGLICAVIMVIVALWIMGQMLGDKSKPSLPTLRPRGRERTPDEDEVLPAAGRRGQKLYAGTNWLNEELKGRVDEKGNIYSGTNWLNEEKIGRIDEQGHIFRGTSWLNEEVVGRIDDEGNMQRGTNWLNEEKVGRVDEKGNVYQGTNWLNEKKIGRTEKSG